MFKIVLQSGNLLCYNNYATACVTSGKTGVIEKINAREKS